MKNLTIVFLASMMLLSSIPYQGRASEVIKGKPATATPAEAKEAQLLLSRLNEIKEMDKSEMSRVEKRTLRKEVQTIKETLNKKYDGVFISVGAIIIILLLLILLL